MFQITLVDQGRELELTSASCSNPPLRFHALWLRDNAQDPATRAPGNGQRLVSLQQLPIDTRIVHGNVIDRTLRLTFDPEQKTIDYDIDWLLRHAYCHKPTPVVTGWLADGIDTWDQQLGARLPHTEYSAVQSDPAARHNWLEQLARYGFAVLKAGPVEEGALFSVVALFGYVRETNYGRHFEVRTEIDPSNLAYTGLALQAHTDNPYRDPVPTLQVLYCLQNSTRGGENRVVDGYNAALRLKMEDPAGFDLLCRYCARFAYAGTPGVVLRARRPILELAPDGELLAIRFNHRSTAALTDVPFDAMEHYYAAYRRLGEIIEDPALAVGFKLAPGDCFVVDNTRVLHARTAFSGAGSRWLQGCYADKDGLLSTIAAYRQTQQTIR